MHIKNTHHQFGAITIALHWIMALLIIGMLTVGLYMADLPLGPQKIKLYGWHKEVGFIVLALALFRLFWRLKNISPSLPIPPIEKLLAKGMHWLLYVLMIAMPITGWLLTSAAGFPVSFFGLFTIPNLIADNEIHRELFETVHLWLGYALITAILLHTLAALKHYLIDKDSILQRMFGYQKREG